MAAGANPSTSPLRQAQDAASTGSGGTSGRSPVAILCDACKQDVGSPRRVRRPLKRGIVDVGLSCPHCGFWVHLHYSSPELELAYTTLMRFKAKAGMSRAHRMRYERKVAEFVRKETEVRRLGERIAEKTKP